MGNEVTTLSFEIDFGNSVENFNSIASAGERLSQVLTEVKSKSKDMLPDANKQIDESSQNIESTLNRMTSIEDQLKGGKLDSYQIGVKTEEFQSLATNLSSIIADIKTVQRLTDNIGRQTTNYTQKQIKTYMPQLMGMARNAADIYKQSGSLASDEQILAAMKQTSKYEEIKSALLGKEKKGSAAIDDILRLSVIKGVSQVQRGSFMGRLGKGSTKQIFDSFQDMLPVGFKAINAKNGYIDTATLSKLSNENNKTLTAKETSQLYELLKENQFALEAAEAANIATRKNGRLYVQKGVSRGMVKSMGQHLYDDIVTAGKGMEMYGIEDINDPVNWERIARKSNKRFTGGMHAARRLSDNFGWFQAERYNQSDYNQMLKSNLAKQSNWKREMYDAGTLNFSPTPNSYEVANYTLEDIRNGKNWNDRTKKYDNYADYHHIVADESLHLNTIMSHSKGGIKRHNSYLDDLLYLEIDPRLSDPNLDKAEREKIISEYADIFQHGISGKGKNNANEDYVLSRINPKMGAEFIRKSIYDKIRKEDPTYFSAGLGMTDFTDWKTYASAMEYRNKNATPGKSIQKLFGSDLPQNIVVVDLENTTKGEGGAGLNGASVISNRLVQKGFQGRAHGIKTALSSVDIDKLIDTYGGELYLTSYTGSENEKETLLDENGKAKLDSKGREMKVGKRIKIDKGVDMIVNAADLKNADARFAGMTNEEITKEVQKDIQKGIYANRLYSDANGKTRWISGQLAQTFAMDKSQSAMFAKSFMEHYKNVGNYDYALEHVFGGDNYTHDLLVRNPELFGSKTIQNKISDYRQAIMARMLRGDIMLPEDTKAYKGMVAPWLIDAFNADMQTKRKGETLSAFESLSPETQKRLNGLTLGDNRVLFQKTLASKLGLGRYPATGQSIQSVTNANGDKNIAKFAESIGLDPYGLYVSTTSPLMQLLQDADFDGDVMEIIELATKEEKGASVAKVMDKIISATVKRNKALYKSGKISKEELEQRDELLKRERQHGNKFSTDFRTKRGARNAAEWLSDYALQASAMGSPNATVRNAFQMTPDSEIATALIDADRQYSMNSVEGKRGYGRNTSSEQMSVIGKYKPFSEFYRMVDKSRDEFGKIDPAELQKKNFFGVNLPSASMSGSMRSQNLARFIAKNVYGYDINQGYNWDEIFETAHGDINPETAVGRMKLGLKDTIKGVINADYLAPSDLTVAQLLQLKARALEEETNKVAIERQNGLLKGRDLRKSDESIAARRISSQGGNVIDNLVSYALTQNSSTLGENRDLIGQLNQLGITNAIGKLDLSKYITGDVTSVQALKQEATAKRLLQRNDVLSQIETFDQETREKTIDNLKISPSLLSLLMKDPSGWAAHYLGGSKDNTLTPYTHIGYAAHGAIEGFMRKRLDRANQENPTQMTDEELSEAAKVAVADFEQYFQDNVGKQGLSKTDYAKLKTSNSYKNIIKYLQNDLVNLFPEKDYEVAAIEGQLGFDLGNKIRKNENGEQEAVTSQGFLDLLFRNRKTGEYRIADMKNYPNPTPHDKAMWQMQQLLYASALPSFFENPSINPKEGAMLNNLIAGNLEGISIIEPIQGLTEEINSSPEAIQENLSKAQKGVQMIQTLANNGFQMEEVLKVSKALDDMFGGKGFSEIAGNLQKETERSEHMQSQMQGNAGEGVSAALVMHDEYNKAMQSLSRINGFIWKNDEDKDIHIPGGQWQQNYQQLAMQQNVVRDLRNSKMDIQADMLENEIANTENKLNELLPKNAISDLSKAFELLQGINKEETSSKKANSKVEEFKALKEQIESASDAYTVLESKIYSNRTQIQDKKAILKATKNEEERTNLKNEIAMLEAENKDYVPAAKKAKEISGRLDDQYNKYLNKNKQEIWNDLLKDKEMLQAQQAGTAFATNTSITEDMQTFIRSVNQRKADAMLYAKEIGIDEDSEQYASYIKELNDMLSFKNMRQFRNKSIDQSLFDFEQNKERTAGHVYGMQISTMDKIESIVSAQKARIEQEKANLQNKYKDQKLTPEQQARYDALMEYYDSFNEDAYRKQVTNEINNQTEQQRQSATFKAASYNELFSRVLNASVLQSSESQNKIQPVLAQETPQARKLTTSEQDQLIQERENLLLESKELDKIDAQELAKKDISNTQQTEWLKQKQILDEKKANLAEKQNKINEKFGTPRDIIRDYKNSVDSIENEYNLEKDRINENFISTRRHSNKLFKELPREIPQKEKDYQERKDSIQKRIGYLKPGEFYDAQFTFSGKRVSELGSAEDNPLGEVYREKGFYLTGPRKEAYMNAASKARSRMLQRQKAEQANEGLIQDIKNSEEALGIIPSEYKTESTSKRRAEIQDRLSKIDKILKTGEKSEQPQSQKIQEESTIETIANAVGEVISEKSETQENKTSNMKEAQKYSQQARAAEVMRNAIETREKLKSMSKRNAFEQKQLDDLTKYTSDENRTKNEEKLADYFARQDELTENEINHNIAAIQENQTFGDKKSAYNLKQWQRQQRQRYVPLSQAWSATQQTYEALELEKESLQNAEKAEQNKLDDLKARQAEAPESDKKKYDEQIAKTTANLHKYQTELGNVDTKMESLSGPANVAKSAFMTVGNAVTMMLKRFGRQMFMKAINEAKQFIKQFDATMTEIQMITLKTDDQMSELGDGMIEKAKQLKVSIADVGKTYATLYRQGLTDEQVSERADVITKFSKVSGAKVEDAVKLVTVAMNTGLVSNATQAADIVTALGDNAATNAQQIEKGIEKAGAAAAADGTTFAELAAMLTAITSTTQIGGNVAGRTLNTIFGRMNKIGTNELIYDENGNAVSGSAVAKLLKAQGVDTYDNQGNKRSSFDVLYDLSKKWNNISDAGQQQLASAIAGTRQYSNFAAIMQGMSEGKIDEYMGLVADSAGITDEKYEVRLKSLDAALTDIKNTFDSMIKDLADKGVLDNIVDGVEGIINAFGSLSSATGGLTGLLIILSGIAVAMSAIRGGAPGAITTAAIMTTVTAGTLIAGAVHKNNVTKEEKKAYQEKKDNNKISNEEAYTNYKNYVDSLISQRENLINRTKELGENKEILSGAETQELASNLEELNTIYNSLGSSSSTAASGLDSWQNACETATIETEKLKTELQDTLELLGKAARNDSMNQYRKDINEIREDIPLSEENLQELQGITSTYKRTGRTAENDIVNITDQLENFGVTRSDFMHLFADSSNNGRIAYAENLDEQFTEKNPDITKARDYYGPTGGNRAYSTIASIVGQKGSLDSSSKNGALINLLLIAGLLNNYDNNEKGIAKIDYSKQKDALRNFYTNTFSNSGLFTSLFENNKDVIDWLETTFQGNPDGFAQAMMNGFKDHDLTNAPEGMLSALYSRYAEIISGEDTTWNSIFGKDITGKIKQRTNRQIENLAEFYDMGKASQYKTAIIGNVKKDIQELVDNGEYSDYQAAFEANYDRLFNEKIKEANEAVEKGEKYEGEDVEQSLEKMVDSIILDNKTLGYKKEKASLLRAAKSSENYSALAAKEMPSIQSFVASGNDVQLVEILQDLQAQKNGATGIYTLNDLIAYLEKQVYDSSESEAKGNLINTAHELSQARVNLSMMGKQGNESIYKTISSAIKRPIEWVSENYLAGKAEYENYINKLQSEHEQSIKNLIDKEFGISGETEISEETINKINDEYKDLVSVTAGENGKGLVYEFKDIGTGKRAADLLDRTPIYTNAEMASLANRILSDTTLSKWEDITKKTGIEGYWDQDQLEALASKYPDLVKYYRMLDNQRKSGEGIALLQNVQDQVALEGIDTSTLGGIFTYGTTAYQQSNKAGLAANRIFEAISADGIQNFEDLTNAVNGQTVEDWLTLMQAAPDLADKFAELGVTVKDGQLDFSGLQAAGKDFESTLLYMQQLFSSQSEQYKDQYQTDQEILTSARSWEGGTSDLGKSEYQQIVGHALTSKRASGVGLTDFEQQYANTLLSNYENGVIGLTDDQRLTGFETIMQHLNPETGIDKDWLNSIDSSVLDAYTSSYKDLVDAIRNGEPDKASEAWDRLNEQFEKDKTSNITKYNKNASKTAETLTALKKGGKDGAQAIANLRKEQVRLNDTALAINNAKGKKGNQLDKNDIANLSSATGEDSNLIKKMSEQEIEQLRQRAQASIDEDFVSEFVEPIQGRLNELMTENPVDLEMAINAHIGSDGALDAGEIAAIAAELNDEALTALASQAGTIGTYLIDIIKSGLSITAIGKILQGNVKGSGKRMGGGGGGGGGGKSEADKLIEKQKREMQVLEHQNKLLQTEEKTLEYQNDYEGQNENLNEQINLQYKLRDAYTANIQELQQMMDKTKADTDDWYKLRDAIYAAEEALKEIINTQNELASKSISITERKIENEDKPGTHMSNMLEKYAQRAMSEDRYSDYVKFTNDQIDELTAQRATNDTQLEYWKDEMKKFVEGEQGWIDARDKLWEVEEENAELDNQLVQMRLDLAEQELSQIGKVLQQDTQSAVHNQTIAETYGSSYESGGYRKQYEDMIREQTAATKTIIEENKKAEQSAKEQMDALDENTTAWFEAQAAVFQYQEAVAQAEVTLSELNRALAQSEIDKINEDYADQTRELLHVNELLSEQAQEYLDLKDTSAYIEAMQMVTTNLGDAIEESAKKVDRLNETYKKGMDNGSLDPAMQRELLDQINEAESEYQRFLLDRSKKQREINKAALDELFEDQDWAASEHDHNIKLLGYQNSIYQNNGELTNVNATIKEENILRSKRVLALQDELTNLEKQKALFEDDQEQEKRIVEQIKKHEEAIEQENAQIKKNNKLLEENEKKIMQVRKTLEDAVDKEIEAEKKRQREILSANVSMQDTIVNLLKKRLQDEWDLKKKDIEKEKESLAEYKNLINERFNYRKKASQQADKDEELAEYRRQLALIEADPSRTKDAKELRRKIEDLEKEQAWTIAEDEVTAESERVDDQIKGMDKFVQYNDELLNEILSDANNFATEMNDILSGSFEESYNKIIEFMSKENEAFMKSLPDAQKQMIQSWEDTWKKANDIVDSNYDLITEMIADKDTFLEFMRSSNRDYRSYLENGDKNSMNLLERQWSEQYDNYVNSIKTGAEFDLHGHELTPVESKIDELKDNIFKVNTVDITGKPIDPYGLGEKSGVTTDFSNGEELNLTDLSDLHYVAPPPAEETPNVPQTDTGSGNGNPSKKEAQTYKYRMYDDKGIELNYWVEANSPEEAELALDILKATGEVPEWYSVTSSALSDSEVNAKKGKGGKDIYKSNYGDETPTETFNRGATNIANDVKDAVNNIVTPVVKPIEEAATSIFDTIKSLFGFSSGGLVDYTGLAKVHGTPSKPEAFLSATDTKNIRTMLDAFNTVSVNPGIIPDTSMFTDNSTNVGDINVTINQAELKDDADYAEVAKRVGEEFSKQIKRGGINLSGYAFS